MNTNSFEMPNPTVIGVDVGGTKIAAGIVSGAGQIYNEVKFSTDTATPEAVLQSIGQTITRLIESAGPDLGAVRGIGLGVPGKVDPARGLGIFAANLGWQNVPVCRWLEEKLGIPCRIENDVRAAALGESLYGAWPGKTELVYLSLGTGIACGAVIGGQLYRGQQGMAGEIGHLPVLGDGPLCRCGGRGCLEALAAGPAIAKRATAYLQDWPASLLSAALAAQGQLNAEAVFEAARREDKVARRVLDETAGYLAYALHLLTLAFDPQVIVLGGGLISSSSLLMEYIQVRLKALARQYPVFGSLYHPGLVQSTTLGRQAGILGAAALFQLND